MSDLAELFERDPLKLTDQDITTIIARMREAQAQYELGGLAPKKTPTKRTTKTESILKELGLT